MQALCWSVEWWTFDVGGVWQVFSAVGTGGSVAAYALRVACVLLHGEAGRQGVKS